MSSSPNSFQDNFDSHEPRPKLESPFLNEEYLAEEARTAPTWRTPVPGFQLESPFLHAFEEGWGAIGEGKEVEEYDEFLNELDEEEIIPEFESDVARSDLQVSAEQVTAYNQEFRNKSGEQFKALIEWAAKKVDINPGLLAVNLLAETYRRDYLSKSMISSMLVGTDDFFEKRYDIAKKVSAYADIGWDKKKKPVIDFNEKGREVKVIFFNSGQDALLASAVYLKHGEEVLREAAAKSGHNFDLLPVEIRFTLIRLAFNAGHGRALKNLKQVLEGQDILIRKRQKKAGPQRQATIHAAQAIHISEKVFNIPVVNTTPEIKEFLDELYEEEFEGDNFTGDFISDRSEEIETEDFEKFLDEEEQFEEEEANLPAKSWEDNYIPSLTNLSLMHDDFKTLVQEDEIIGFDTGSNLNLQISVPNDGSTPPERISITATVWSPRKPSEIIVTQKLNVPKSGLIPIIGGSILYKLSVPVSDLGNMLLSVDGVKDKEVATVRRIGGTSDVKFIRALGSRWKGRGQAQQADQCGIGSASLADERPDALKLLQSGGVAILEIQILSTSFKVKRFIRNPADVFYYTGHGLGFGFSGGAAPLNCLAINDGSLSSITGGFCCWAKPSDIIPHWKSPMDLDVFIIAGCSVLAVDASTGTVKGDGLEWAKLLKVNRGPLIALLGYGDVDENETNKNGSLGPIGGTAPLDRVAGDPIAKEMGKWIKEHPKFNGIIKKWLWINVFHENFMAIGMDKDGFCWRTRRRATSRWETVNKDKLVSHEKRNITFVIEKIKM
jgi:hypothetical protein